jgi:hypothetical protein
MTKLVEFLQNGKFVDINLFEVSWIKTIRYKEDFDMGVEVTYVVTLTDGSEVSIPRSAIGLSYYNRKLAEGLAVAYFDKACELIRELAYICENYSDEEVYNRPLCYPFAEWIRQRLGVDVYVPAHSIDRVFLPEGVS